MEAVSNDIAMIYRYRATIPESKVFFRVYDVPSGMTLFDLHSFILNNLEFTPDQMVCFEAYGPTGKRTSQYALFDLGHGSMDKVTLEMLAEREENVINYVFDLRTGRIVRLEFLGEAEFSAKLDYPCAVDGKGVNPDQFSAKYEDAEPISLSPSKKSRASDPDDDDEEFDDDDDEFDDEDEDEDDDIEEEELLVDEDFGK